MSQGYTNQTLDRAKTLRKALTAAEITMWEIVRDSRLGARFRRQQPIGPFIAHFYCASHDLIVEVDGVQHNDDPAKDERRTAWLATKGYDVIRFTNAEVVGDVESVIRTLRQRLGRGPHPAASRHPSPSRGEGV